MILVKNISKSFAENGDDTFHALKDINLSINSGECVVLKGVSGSGKSTLLSIIGAIMKPTSGSVEIDGFNIVSLSDFHISHYRNKTIGFVTQSFHLFEHLNVKDNLLAPLVINDYTSKEIDERIANAMEIANISHKAKSKISTLSGGEKQRCMIARALVNEPSIILCDEPTANLDEKNSLIFIKIIKKLKNLNKTVIIATHDPLFDEQEMINKVVNISEGTLE